MGQAPPANFFFRAWNRCLHRVAGAFFPEKMLILQSTALQMADLTTDLPGGNFAFSESPLILSD
jgi:hypothetical protein